MKIIGIRWLVFLTIIFKGNIMGEEVLLEGTLLEEEFREFGMGGVSLGIRWDNETERDYWYIDGLDEPEEVQYFKTARGAYEYYVNYKNKWPSEVIMGLSSYMHKEFHRLSREREGM